MKRIIYILTLIIFTFSSCYDDLGNYDYHDINDLAITGIEESYSVDVGETMQITPTLEGRFYNADNKFSFEWIISEEVVSTEKNLELFIDMTMGQKLCRYIITDNETGVKDITKFFLNVTSETGSDAIIVLSNYKGQADISFMRIDKENATFETNYYTNKVGKPLGIMPKSLHRNYNIFNVNSGLQVLTDEGLRCLDHNTLLPLEGDPYLAEGFIMDYYPPYPQPDLTGYDVEFVKHYISAYHHTPYGGIQTSSKIDMISGGNYYYMFLSGYTKPIKVNLASPYGGRLSPYVFKASVIPTVITDGKAGNYYRGYKISQYSVMFDQQVGRFLLSNVGGQLYGVEYIPDYLGYDLIYGSHTYDENITIAALTGAAGSKLVMFNKITDSREEKKIKGEVDVSSDVINKDTRFYCMKNVPYIYFVTGTKLYRYNILDIESGVQPTVVVANLTDYGYDATAEITSLFMTRTEKHLILGVSRYGDDKEAMSDELKGDVLVIDADMSGGYELENKYESICGYPVDVMVKYKYFYRDGKDEMDINIMDNI